ncbi:hypothetical protein [Jonesia quinghaiensis]|uniref:hypothetical protein n=1 Tax=Jonesia quinghaiensis TaxID=262806 RepID=UPI00041AAE31|nr:hypothetical protein [Jonesia quinghaiensis]
MGLLWDKIEAWLGRKWPDRFVDWDRLNSLEEEYAKLSDQELAALWFASRREDTYEAKAISSVIIDRLWDFGSMESMIKAMWCNALDDDAKIDVVEQFHFWVWHLIHHEHTDPILDWLQERVAASSSRVQLGVQEIHFERFPDEKWLKMAQEDIENGVKRIDSDESILESCRYYGLSENVIMEMLARERQRNA